MIIQFCFKFQKYGFDEDKVVGAEGKWVSETEETEGNYANSGIETDRREGRISWRMSEVSLCTTDDDDDNDW